MPRLKRWIIVLFEIGKEECAILANIFRATRELLKAEEDVGVCSESEWKKVGQVYLRQRRELIGR